MTFDIDQEITQLRIAIAQKRVEAEDALIAQHRLEGRLEILVALQQNRATIDIPEPEIRPQ